MLATLRQAARVEPDWDVVPMATYVLSDDQEAEAVLAHVIEYFGTDKRRTSVRLVFEHEEVRYMRRQDAYTFVEPQEKGFGDSARSRLLSLPIAGGMREYQFRCPRRGCPESPVFMLAFTDNPTCRIHKLQLKLVP